MDSIIHRFNNQAACDISENRKEKKHLPEIRV
jgi:hypothetical protein